MNEIIPGINIQWPWSQLLIDGIKSVETRGYPLPSKFINCKLAIIETPGKEGRKKENQIVSRIVGTIIFSNSFRYGSRAEWEKDFFRHLVPLDHPDFRFIEKKEKWGWVVSKVEKFDRSLPTPKRRGIVFTAQCEVVL